MLVCCSLCTLVSFFAAKPLLHADIIFCGVALNSGIFKLNPFWSLLPIEHLWTGKINHPLTLKFFPQLRLVSYCCFLQLSLNCLSPRTASKVSSSTYIVSYLLHPLAKMFKTRLPSSSVPKSSNLTRVRCLGIGSTSRSAAVKDSFRDPLHSSALQLLLWLFRCSPHLSWFLFVNHSSAKVFQDNRSPWNTRNCRLA